MPDPMKRRVPCSALTKKGKLCPIDADREHEGKFYCHVHDPKGTFKLTVEANKRIRAATKRNLAKITVKRFAKIALHCPICGSTLTCPGCKT